MLTTSEYVGEAREGVKWKGGNLTTHYHYGQIAVNVAGTTAANVFSAFTVRSVVNVNSTLGVTGTNTGLVGGNTYAPTSGTITGFGLSSLGHSGTVTLWSTTSGTIAQIAGSGTAGVWVGTATAIAGSFVAGDIVTVTPTAGSQVCYVTFQTQQ